MVKELECVLLEDNYGAQYQNYFLSIVLTKPQNKSFVYENYIELGVKHACDSHIDYSFDGIYTCGNGMMDKFIIRGPAEDLRRIILDGINHGDYVVLNVNEQFLPNRQAYGKYYFRHDLLIVGYDDQAKRYITVGFDANMKYSKICYDFSVVEEAYYRMPDEWDFEVFLFHFHPEFHKEWNLSEIRRHLENYLAGKNPNRIYLESFLAHPEQSIEFVNNSYLGEYYGINVYDYLIKRVRKQYQIWGSLEEGDQLSVLDLRSLNTLRTHSMLLRKMLEEMRLLEREEIMDSLVKNEKSIMAAKLLLLKYFSDGNKKTCRKAVKRLEQVKQQESSTIHVILECIW